MAQEQWTAVDHYLSDLFVPEDTVLDAALRASVEAGLPPINVAPNQGKLLHILARSCGARSILEIGTLGGYSTIWLARALPAGGRLVTLEADASHAKVARANIERARLGDVVEIRLRAAVDTLPLLAAEAREPLYIVFIDADKVNCAAYFEWSLKMTRPGSLIIVDHIVPQGQGIDATSPDPSVQGVREVNAAIVATPTVTAT